MSVKRRNGIWHYDFTDAFGRRHRGSTRVRDKAAAIKVEALLREQAALGQPARKVPTIEDAAAAWFRAKMAGKASQVSVARRLNTMLRLIGPSTLITRIDAPMIEAAIQARRLEPKKTQVTKADKGKVAVSNATVNRDLIDQTLRPILNYHRKTLKFPLAPIDWGELRQDEPRERVREYTPAEETAWRDSLPAWHRPLFNFLIRYGPRLGEAFFHPSAVDPQGWITIKGEDRKADGDLVIPLLEDDARDMVARATRAINAGLETVWFKETVNRRGDTVLEPTTPRGFQSASAKAKKRAGIKNARAVHDFRHHAATKALRASGNMKTVQKLLGHATIASTARYAHSDTRDVLETLRLAYVTKPSPPDEIVSDNNADEA